MNLDKRTATKKSRIPYYPAAERVPQPAHAIDLGVKIIKRTEWQLKVCWTVNIFKAAKIPCY